MIGIPGIFDILSARNLQGDPNMRIASPIPRLIALLAVMFQCAYAAPHEPNGEYVVLVHGILRSSAHMQPLADYLTECGYDVINIDYPSTHYPIEYLIDHIAQDLDHLIMDKSRRVHFVGYSMGGLLVRGIVAQHRPEHLGRIVLIAPPNHGSEVANFWKNNILYQWLYGPAGQQLTTDVDWEKIFGPVDDELGIIAGDRTIDPFSSYLIGIMNDGKVSVESTKLEGMTDHVIIAATHTFFPSNKEAQIQVCAFLKTGHFGAES